MKAGAKEGIEIVKAVYNVRRWIRCFYDDAEGGTVWVMFEDVDGYIHYQSIGYDTDRQQMLSQQFYKTFTRSDLQASNER